MIYVCVVWTVPCHTNAITCICLFVDVAKAAQADDDGDGDAGNETVVSHKRNSNPQQLKYANVLMHMCVYERL